MSISESISQKYMVYKASKIKQYPHTHNNASEVGHPCERFLVLSRTRWKDKPLHDVNLQLIFDEGQEQERVLLRELTEAGINVLEQQRSFYDETLKLSGRIDAIVSFEGSTPPLEIKSMSPFSFENINSIEDMLEDKYACKYPAQLTMYCYLKPYDFGLFILKNKSNGQIKVLEMPLDYNYAEQLLKKLERVNKHVSENSLPEVISDISICKDCPFLHICMPDIKNSALVFSDDAKMIELLNRREQLQMEVSKVSEAQKELNKLDKTIKPLLEGKEKIMYDNWIVTGKWIERKGFVSEPSKYWKYSIERIEW